MKRFKKTFNYAILLTLCFSLNSCVIFLIMGPIEKNRAIKHYTIEKKSIPADFGNKCKILLMGLEGKKSYDKYLKKNAEKFYTGKYKIIANEELSDKKYADLDTYRYYFYFELGSVQYAQANGGRPDSYKTRRLYVLDRKENVIYYASKTSGYFSKMMQGYFINLSKELVKSKK